MTGVSIWGGTASGAAQPYRVITVNSLKGARFSFSARSCPGTNWSTRPELGKFTSVCFCRRWNVHAKTTQKSPLLRYRQLASCKHRARSLTLLQLLSDGFCALCSFCALLFVSFPFVSFLDGFATKPTLISEIAALYVWTGTKTRLLTCWCLFETHVLLRLVAKR